MSRKYTKDDVVYTVNTKCLDSAVVKMDVVGKITTSDGNVVVCNTTVFSQLDTLSLENNMKKAKDGVTEMVLNEIGKGIVTKVKDRIRVIDGFRSTATKENTTSQMAYDQLALRGLSKLRLNEVVIVQCDYRRDFIIVKNPSTDIVHVYDNYGGRGYIDENGAVIPD